MSKHTESFKKAVRQANEAMREHYPKFMGPAIVMLAKQICQQTKKEDKGQKKPASGHSAVHPAHPASAHKNDTAAL